MRRIIELFESGNVQVAGLRRRGKDMLMANVVVRRKKPYISNTNYGGEWYPLDFDKLDCGMNSYKNFITGEINRYVWPYPMGTDVYIGDCGVYLPAQYCNELNRQYPHLPTFFAISAQVGGCNVHTNCQAARRVWDKAREQGDIFIYSNWCKVFFGKLVIQKVTLYDRFESFERYVPPFPLRRPLFNRERRFQWEIQCSNYLIAHGMVKPRILIYFNRSSYNTLIFKEILENGKEKVS